MEGTAPVEVCVELDEVEEDAEDELDDDEEELLEEDEDGEEVDDEVEVDDTDVEDEVLVEALDDDLRYAATPTPAAATKTMMTAITAMVEIPDLLLSIPYPSVFTTIAKTRGYLRENDHYSIS